MFQPRLFLTTTPSGSSFIQGLDWEGKSWSVQLNLRGQLYAITVESYPKQVGVDAGGWVTRELQPVELPASETADTVEMPTTDPFEQVTDPFEVSL